MSAELDAPKAYCLRDLPLPAKIVISCFLLAVGAGYSAAMVQLHMQDSKSGEMMPTVHDVILKFTGKKWFETDPPRPINTLEKLVAAPESLTFGGSGTMAPAFFARDGEGFNRAPEAEKNKLRPERDGERKALVEWSNSPADVRERAYQSDHFAIEPVSQPAAITPDFRNPDGTYKVKSILDTRCARCHSKDGSDTKAQAFPLETYAQVAKYIQTPHSVSVPPGGGWVKVEEPIGLEKLTQSTHAHLLSFAMLFALTGLVFAFSSYPTVLRCVLGPWVLVFVFADVCLWWLARLSPEWGPYFSMAIIGTGGAVGLGLGAQIVLSLFNMYGVKGRIVLVLLFAAGAAAVALVYIEKIKPGLIEKQGLRNAVAQAPAETERKPEEAKPAPQPQPVPKANANAAKIENNVPTSPEKRDNPAAAVPSPMEKALMFPVKNAAGQEVEVSMLPFKGDKDGGMVRAFFDKDGVDYNKTMKDAGTSQEEKTKLRTERTDELAALTAWMRLADAERKKSYDADGMPMPPTITGKPFTPEYVAGGKVKIKTLIADRCYRCHQEGSDADKYPLGNYEQILKELQPAK